MEIISNDIHMRLTVAERSKLTKELEEMFCKVDTDLDEHYYNMGTITKKFPTVAYMFKILSF